MDFWQIVHPVLGFVLTLINERTLLHVNSSQCCYGHIIPCRKLILVSFNVLQVIQADIQTHNSEALQKTQPRPECD